MDMAEVYFWYRAVLFGGTVRNSLPLSGPLEDFSSRKYLFFVRLVIDTLGAPTGVWFKKLPMY